jgi:hypothetical protein
MKKIRLLVCCILFWGQLSGQITFIDHMFDFSSGMPAYVIKDTTQPNNKWYIGHPQKVFFDSAYSAGKALVTDTLNLFPAGDTSSFIIRFDFGLPLRFGKVWFETKYDFDSLLAGGFFEIRYYLHSPFPTLSYYWTNWVNMANDSLGLAPICYHFTNYDTIVGGTPALTGRSNGWENIQFSWFWNMAIKGPMIYPLITEIRFTAVSHPTALPSEGWMIDNLYLYAQESIGSIADDHPGHFKTEPYPNPGQAGIRIQVEQTMTESLTLEVFHQGGQIMEKHEFAPDEPITLQSQDYPAGMYLYRVTTRSGRVSQGRFIKL